MKSNNVRFKLFKPTGSILLALLVVAGCQPFCILADETRNPGEQTASHGNEYRVWATSSGKFTVVAKFHSHASANVIRLIRKDSGKIVEVKKSILSAADREWLERFQKPPSGQRTSEATEMELGGGADEPALFLPLGDLPGGEFLSKVTAVAMTGPTVVGSSVGTHGTEAFRWTKQAGMMGLSDLPGGAFRSAASSISDDGKIIVGMGQSASRRSDGFHWTEDRGMVSFEQVLPDMSYSMLQSLRVSGSGSAFAGLVFQLTESGRVRNQMPSAFIWSKARGLRMVNYLQPVSLRTKLSQTHINGISRDGNAVIGRELGMVDVKVTSLGVWKHLDVALMRTPDLSGGTENSTPVGVSGDGSVVCGYAKGSEGTEAFVWNVHQQASGLGDLPGGQFLSRASGISADGRIVVGASATDRGMEAFVWTRHAGMTRLQELMETASLNVRGWRLSSAVISSDGHTIAGTGINPSGMTEGWVLLNCAAFLKSMLPVAPLPKAQDFLADLPPIKVNTLGMKFRPIPQGSFVMGGDTEFPADEKRMRFQSNPPRAHNPAHRVEITQPFEMSIYEVTYEQFNSVMKRQNQFPHPNHPATGVLWSEAVEFCKRLTEMEKAQQQNYSYRLPTEAEWEYACRANTRTRYSFGSNANYELGFYAWCSLNYQNPLPTRPVGQKFPNPWGIYDMYGNASEWCADWYGPYANAASTDPLGTRPAKGSWTPAEMRVIRGGDANSVAWGSAGRGGRTPEVPWEKQGFRVVRTVINN